MKIQVRMGEKMKVDLNDIALHSIYAKGVGRITTEYCGKLFKRYMVSGSILELGPAEGVMTEILCKNQSDYTVVDGAEYFIEEIKRKFPKVKAYCSYFENFKPERQYDNIILGHVLEHVDNPEQVLKLCKQWLKQEGRILSAVPNSESLHRQAAVKMGLLERTSSFSEKDICHGHQRIYNYQSFQQEFIQIGYEILVSGGYWLKPLPDKLIEKDWTRDQIDAFFELGEKYPEIAGEIYIIAK